MKGRTMAVALNQFIRNMYRSVRSGSGYLWGANFSVREDFLSTLILSFTVAPIGID